MHEGSICNLANTIPVPVTPQKPPDRSCNDPRRPYVWLGSVAMHGRILEMDLERFERLNDGMLATLSESGNNSKSEEYSTRKGRKQAAGNRWGKRRVWQRGAPAPLC